MTVTHTHDGTRMVSSLSGEVAIRVGSDAWRVSWLDGLWNRNQASTAMAIAETVAGPTITAAHHAVVHRVFLPELGLDGSALDRIGGGR